ncbi:MAG: ATP-binding protein [candidate division KSB1 bacterium]|nr:ATP-binding protein [candidate division KSB1 bacterium]MDZ7304038.1 ATP-binding protein [candidate division KSB1 bacterium]MDZ7313251.1 ATP-binding protein [candidate division KSB1 bacterium]
MMRKSIFRLFILAATVLVILPIEGRAQWAEDYERGMEELRNGRWDAAANSFRAALRRQPKPDLNAREYGLNYFEYLPYYQLGRALFFQLDFAGAIEHFENELSYGVIQKSNSYQDLLRLRETASALQAQIAANKAATKSENAAVWMELLNESYRRGRDLKQKMNIDSLLVHLEIEENRRIQISRWFAQLPQPAAQTRVATDSVSVLKNAAQAAFLQGRYREALDLFNRLAQVAPGDPMLADWQQRLRFELSRLEQAAGETLTKTDTIKVLQSGAPIIIIREPEAEMSRMRGKQVHFHGTAHDDVGIAAIAFTLNGEPFRFADGSTRLVPTQNADGTFPFDCDIPLKPGENQIAVTAYDLDFEQHTSTQMRRITRLPPLYQTAPFWLVIGAGMLVVFGAIAGNRLLKYRIAVVHRYNPYIAGAPIRDEKMFFGHQQLIERILRTIPNNSIMVFGPRRIGKTSLQYQLQRALKERQHPEYSFVPVFIDLQGVAEEMFFAHLIADVSEQLGPQIASTISTSEDRKKYGHREFANDLRRVIDRLQARAPEKKVRLVFLMDEVDELNRYSERTNQQLRAIFMKSFSENLAAVLTGSTIRKKWESESSPWYNFFEQIPMPALTRDEAMQLIHAPVKGFFKYAPEAANRIWEISEGKPFVIQKFCVRLVNLAIERRRRKIGAAEVEAIRQEVLHDTTSSATSIAQSA